jgi:hypothetical protein
MTDSAQLVARNGLFCRICSGPIPLETSKTDERGKAVHEDCYVRKMKFRSLAGPTRWMHRLRVGLGCVLLPF